MHGAFFFTDFPNSYIPNILEEIYKDRVYEPFLAGKKDLTIVEIGANIGLVSHYFKDFAKIVYAIEPSKQHLDNLQKLVDYNKIENIKVCPLAISNHDGMEKFYHNQNVTMFSLKDTVNNKGDFEEVKVQTLETFMKEQEIESVDLLKLDCEGSESELIVSDGFQNVADKIKVIVGEYHSWTNMSQAQFANALTDLGFEFKWLPNTVAQVFTAVKR